MTASRRIGWQRTVRAIAVAVAGLGAAALLWRVRPSASLAGQPDADIVAGCGWLAWALASYLCLAVAGTAAAAVLRWRGLARIAPTTVRRLVDSAISVGLVAAVVSPTAAVAAPARHTTVAASTIQPRAAPLDWPGLTIALPPPGSGAATRPDASPRPVIVQPGDTLWSIAAAHLGPKATRDQIAAAWPHWYAANRHVIGPDPAVIHPGEQLRPPATHTVPEEGSP